MFCCVLFVVVIVGFFCGDVVQVQKQIIGVVFEVFNMKLIGMSDFQLCSVYQLIIYYQGDCWIVYIGYYGGIDEVFVFVNFIMGQMELNGMLIVDVIDFVYF